jgi:long-chain acyl-CoA synthetase
MPVGTIVELLRQAAAAYGPSRCLVYRTEAGRVEYSYRDVLDRSLRVAALLRSKGVQRGDRVVIWGPNRPEWGFAYFGALLLGAIVVPFDVRAAESFLERIESKTEPKVTVAGRTQQESATRPHPGYVTLDSLADEAAAFEPADDLPSLGPDDVAVLMYTSGTTGDPKGVILTHGNIATNLQAVPEVIEIEPHHRFLSLLPLSHVYEQVMGFLVAFTRGASITYIDTLKPQAIFDAMAAEGITEMACVPQLLQLFMNGIEREVRRQGKERLWKLLHAVARRLPFGLRRRLFPTVHRRLGGKFEFFAVGGAYLPPALAQKWENMGIEVVQGYGLTEASPLVAANPRHARKLDSIGKVVSSVRVKLGQDGEILIQGPSVFKGYWQAREATAAAFEEGWYHTGDMGRFDEDGYLYFTGRQKNLIVLANGMNVHAEDVEQALRDTGLVTDAAVFGLAEPGGDQTVHAVLALEDPGKAEEAVRLANRNLAPHQRISGHAIWPDPDFPRTHTLKVRRPEVERRLLAELLPQQAKDRTGAASPLSS